MHLINLHLAKVQVQQEPFQNLELTKGKIAQITFIDCIKTLTLMTKTRKLITEIPPNRCECFYLLSNSQ